MVFSRPLISKSSSPCIKPLMTVTMSTNYNWYNRHFHVPQFFHFPQQGPGTYPSFRFLSILLCGQPGQQSSQFGKFSFLLLFLSLLLLTITSYGHLAKIRWSVYISKSLTSLCVSFSRTDSELCTYYLFVWSNFIFLHDSQWITLPTQSCLVLYSFCDNLLHSLIMWLIVSSLSPHNLYLLFCCVLCILVLI